MKPIIISTFLALSAVSLAQSAKKINAGLRAELQQELRVNDSLRVVIEERVKALRSTELALAETEQYVKTVGDYLRMARQLLQHNLMYLETHDYSGDTLNQAKALLADELLTVSPYTKNFRSGEVRSYPADTLKLDAESRVKDQNTQLQDYLLTLHAVNEKNRSTLGFVEKIDSAYIRQRTAQDKFISSGEQQLKSCKLLLNQTAFVYRRIQDAERRKSEERYNQKVREAQKKAPKGEIAFIPVMLVDYDETPPYFADAIEQKVFHDYQSEPRVIEPGAPVPQTELQIYTFVEEPAEFPGGAAALKKWIDDNLVLPQSVISGDISGKVYTRFVVDEKGRISSAVVVKHLSGCPECDAEAIRLLKAMPGWTPGKLKGAPRKSYFSLPIVFKAQQ